MTAGYTARIGVQPAWRMKAGSVGSWRDVGAEAHKSKPPAEQGHQIKVCSRDLFTLQLEQCRWQHKKTLSCGFVSQIEWSSS